MRLITGRVVLRCVRIVVDVTRWILLSTTMKEDTNMPCGGKKRGKRGK
jgi:hypothetical protein